MITDKLSVEQYTPLWREEFIKIHGIIEEKIRPFKFDIEHVGSTSVEGLWAKPVLDIDIVVSSFDDVESLKKLLAELGYNFRGDLGIPGRYAFGRADECVPYTNPFVKWMRQNLYVCIKDSISLKNHLLFRDALRSDIDLVNQYSELKRELSKKYSHLSYKEAIDLYCEDKTEFITEVLKKYGISEEDSNDIAKVNKVNNG